MIGIRVDSNETIAMGHIMRCMSIAEQMKDKPLFICSDVTSANIVRDREFECVCLENNYNEKEQEIDMLLDIIDSYSITVLIIDSYSITDYYLKALHKRVKLIYIDDLNSFKYDVDMVLNYTYDTKNDIYNRWNYSNVRFLIGSKYVPLRKQFEQEAITIKDDVKSIFLTTGGTDEFHIILGLIEQLIKRKYVIYIVLGKYYADKSALEECVSNMSNIKVYSNVSEIAEIMKKSDIAISAGGTTLAELASLGIPTICFSVADNQLPGTTSYDKNGLMIYAGDVRRDRKTVIDNIIQNIDIISKDINMRKEMARKMQENFDGKGAKRVAEEIESI